MGELGGMFAVGQMCDMDSDRGAGAVGDVGDAGSACVGGVAHRQSRISGARRASGIRTCAQTRNARHDYDCSTTVFSMLMPALLSAKHPPSVPVW
jgi:hypothetical protein